MDSIPTKVNDLWTGVRLVAKVALDAGRSSYKRYQAHARGICWVCNNLQPYGHVNTLRESSNGSHGIGPDDIRLTLEGISTRDILDARTINEQTGLPKRDCRYCRFLCEIFDAFFIDEYMSWVTETLNAMPISVGLMIQEGKPLIINCWGFTYDEHTWNPRVDLEVYHEPFLETTIRLDGAPSIGPAGSRAATAASQKCRRFILECMHQCCNEHRSCVPKATGFVPSRLVFLGSSNEEIRIVESVDGDGQMAWAALSHCWGGSQPHKLLRANHALLKHHINFSDVPATFRNAIEVTRELGLKYLWIDSLCILQDDKADWEVEAASMGAIYGQAVVVLCAASSANPETPFLRQRDEEWLAKSFEFVLDQGVALPIKVRQKALLAARIQKRSDEPPLVSDWALQKRAGPLYARAWCFQETFLAPRAIHFAPGAVVFECKLLSQSEDQLPPYPSSIFGSLGALAESRQWHEIVRAYTQRQLTFQSDKLTAIGGIAGTMPQAKSSKYVAGLWCSTMIQDLLWQVMPGATHRVLSYPRAEYNIPSWSWASLDRGVTWNPLESLQPLAKIVSAESSVVGKNPYGQVAGGRLCLQGRIRPCYVSISETKNEHWVYYEEKGHQSAKRHFRADGQLMPETSSREQGVFARRACEGEFTLEFNATAAFLCIGRTPKFNYDYVGLIICPSLYVEGCRERIGNITNVPSEWYRDGTATTITLV